MQVRNLIVGLMTAAVAPVAAQAALVLYEPFDYGSTSQLLSGVSGTVTGLDGSSYTTGSTATYNAAGSVNYHADGLSFGTLATAGGRAGIVYDTSVRNATRGVDFAVTSGTMYGSFLYLSGGATNNGISDLLFGASGASDTTAKLTVAGNEYDSNSTAKGPNYMGVRINGAGGVGAIAAAPQPQMAEDGTVYLVLFQLSNVGATSGTQTVDAWALTPAQLANFKPGGLTDTELNAAGTGTAADNVFQRVTKSATSGYISVLSTDSMRLYSLRATASFDEIRIANASLDEVTPLAVVPEPSSLAALGILTTILLRRRR